MLLPLGLPPISCDERILRKICSETHFRCLFEVCKAAERGVWPAGARRRIASAAAMLETALGFFIALIVIISFAGLVFLYPLTFRVSVSTGHLALHTAVPDDEEAAEEAEKEAKRESEVFEYVEAVQIRAVNAKDLRLRAERTTLHSHPR